MSIGKALVSFSVRRRAVVTVLMILISLALAITAILPTLWPNTFRSLYPLRVDTDPENMLPASEPVRVFHNNMKRELALYDMVVVGIVNDNHPDGVFNPESLTRIYHLTEFAKTLRWPDPENPNRQIGVVEADLIAPSTVDNIEPGGLGVVKFEWLMPSPPETSEAARAVRDKALRIPFLKDTVVSADGQALCLYLPLTDKHLSHRIYTSLNMRIPIIRAWAALNAKVHALDIPPERAGVLDAWDNVSRIAAFNSRDRKEFVELIRSLSASLAGAGKMEDIAAALEVVGSLQRNEDLVALDAQTQSVLDPLVRQLESLDESSPQDKEEIARLEKKIWETRISASRTTRQTLQKLLAQSRAAESADPWLHLAVLQFHSLQGQLLSAQELTVSLRDLLWAQVMPDTLFTAQILAPLPSLVEEVFQNTANSPSHDQYHIAGLPVAEDTFGVEMFKQMAISAPIAMVVIFLLMLLFFRKLVLIISPMIVALVSVICTMSLLIATGQTVHIMSSMIPIFIMPIAVLDAVHILSEFFDRYQQTKDKRATIVAVMETLFMPMLYTSLTTAAGFASLALTPIPPVQVFGLFVALGVMLAWLWTVTFVPAYVMFISSKSLANFGSTHHEDPGAAARGFLPWIGRMTNSHAKLVLAVTGIVVLVAIYGITKININDNPTKWFKASHPIRVADTVLNEHLGGTYMAYLALEAPDTTETVSDYAQGLSQRMETWAQQAEESTPGTIPLSKIALAKIPELLETAESEEGLLAGLESFVDEQSMAGSEQQAWLWEDLLLFLDSERQRDQVFKDPEALAYVESLQRHLQTTGVVGKSNSLTDIVKTVHREFMEGDPAKEIIPATSAGVAQMLLQYQSSHRPGDLWHFVTPDYRKTSIWVQLTSGDNQDMQRVVDSVQQYVADNPPPLNLRHQWFGLTYINVIWQQKMVGGMLTAFLGSFLVVLLLMTVLFRSALWGLLSMVPLMVTIGLIYGFIGLLGKDYDMPVAVLSSLSLGLSVDYAIHFLARSRELRARYGSWSATVGPVFTEPARAIARNVVVIGVGFLPLLAAPLVPYQTVGIFIAAILLTAGVASLLILPALINLLEPWLFPQSEAKRFTCKCGTCIISAIVVAALLAVNLYQFLSIGWNILTWMTIIIVPILAVLCFLASRRQACKAETAEEQSNEQN